MKYLLMLGLALLAWNWWRQRVRAAAQAQRQEAAAAAPAQNMVPCAQCQVHLPQSLALQGQRGFYCSHEHLRRVEG
jgi:uncharacterized protein